VQESLSAQPMDVFLAEIIFGEIAVQITNKDIGWFAPNTYWVMLSQALWL
jgi:hypothetical protein